MAHFALINENNIVEQVIIVDNNDILDSDGNESEKVGIDFCNSIIPGTWVQTSYNGTIRKHFAGIGYIYDEELDAFIPPQPYKSWLFDEQTCTWLPPSKYPDSGMWVWDEDSVSWVKAN